MKEERKCGIKDNAGESGRRLKDEQAALHGHYVSPFASLVFLCCFWWIVSVHVEGKKVRALLLVMSMGALVIALV